MAFDIEKFAHAILVFIAVVTLAALGFVGLCALSLLQMMGLVP